MLRSRKRRSFWSMTFTTSGRHDDSEGAEVEGVILKKDGLGRVRMPVGKREEILDAFERSGMSGT